jgi:hypothetical protein
VSNWVLNLDLIKQGTIVQLDEERISDRALLRIVILNTEALVLDAMNLSTERVDAWVGGGFVRAAESTL